MKVQLLIANGEFAGKVIYLAGGQRLSVGRTFQNDLSLNDPGVSREHAVFENDGVVLTVTDQKSRNGTLVNLLKTDACFLQTGDQVTVGSTVFHVTTDVGEREVAENPPVEMPFEGLHDPVLDESAPADAASLIESQPLPRDFLDATTETMPPDMARMASEITFLDSHPTCQKCGRVVGKREIASGHATRLNDRWLCPECAPSDIGRVVGQYRILEKIADGATGRIFKAEHVTIKKIVALKILLENIASKESAKLRFMREARNGAALSHPNIVNMFDAGEDKGTYYLVMELVEGPNLEKLLAQEGALDPGRALQIAIQVARALDYAHVKQIVHRDVRPMNVLLAHGDRAKLIDIGTAKWIEATGEDSLTQPGIAFGDFNYLAPELLIPGAAVDPMCDVYSLGATLYAMLAGGPPFKLATLAEALEREKNPTFPPPSFANPKVPEALDTLVTRMMALDPAQRAPSDAALIEEMSDLHARLFAHGAPQRSDDEEEPASLPKLRSESQGDLRLARDIQNKLVPARIPNLPHYDLAKVYQPAKEIGGDYLDFFPVDKDRHAVIIADVSGKGLSGAMVMVMVRSVFKMVALLGKSPAQTIVHANKVLAKDVKKGMFVSLIYGILDSAKHVLHYANAGHNHPVYVHAATGKVMLVRSGGMVLGINTTAIFENTLEEFAVRFAPGDKLVLYTDGVNEAKDDDGKDFGNDTMTSVIGASSEGGSAHVVRTLMEGIASHRGGAVQSDDITIFAIGRTME